ncbi:MAG: response regulator [Bacteroidetes bacterium]|nr:MAG: response regulator [Bacteroidota bacterium]
MHRAKKILSVGILLLGFFFGFSQKADIISVNEGLSQGMVFDIIQSRDGYMWIATKDGLNRYDGYRFKTYSPDTFDPFSIAASEIWGLFEDKKGRIWAFYNGGIDVFIPETGRFYHVPKNLIPGFSFGADYLTCRVTEDGDGSIWIAENGQLWCIKAPADLLATSQKESNASRVFDVKKITIKNAGEKANYITNVYYSVNKELFIGTFDGVYLLDNSSREFAPYALAGRRAYLRGGDSHAIFAYSNNLPTDLARLQISQKEKDLGTGLVWAIDAETRKEVFCRASKEVMLFDKQGNLWSFDKTKIAKWNPKTFANGGFPHFEFTVSEMLANSSYFAFSMLCTDRSNNIWIGTNGYGIRKVVLQQPKFSSYLPLISQRRIFEDPSGFLICSERPDKAFTSKNFNNAIQNQWFQDPSMLTKGAFVFDATGNAWINTQGEGLMTVKKQTGSVERFPWKALGLEMDRKQVLYGVNESGLMVFDTKTGKSKQFPFDKPQRLQAAYWYMHYLHLAPNGVIWIMGFEGLIKAEPSGSSYRFTYYYNNPRDKTSLSNDFVCSVADDPVEPETYLWAGTKGGGLNRLNIKTGKFIHYRTAEGLPDNVVYGILPENKASANYGRLWMSTNKGLSRLDIGSKEFKNFTVADGLQSNEFNLGSYLKTRDGYMIFGGVSGLTVFHPDSLSFNPTIPQTRIVGIEVNNQPYEIGGVLVHKLSYRQNFLNIAFSALEFTNPGQNQYRYQLISRQFFTSAANNKWIDLRQKNTVSLADLPPGHYTFKVQGSNNDGNWSKEPAVFEFVIQPPWWASWWAYLLYLLGAVAIVVQMYRTKLGQRLQQQEAHRLRELDEFKNRFFTNVSHEFRTPLTVILGTTEQLGDLKQVSEVKEKAGLIKRSSQNLLRLINQLLDLAKLESSTLTLNYVKGDALPYLRYIAESLHSLANAQNVMLRVESPEKQVVMDYDPERLMQIVYNLLSNAIKFTPSGGQVILKAALEANRLVLSVTDNGAGIPAADLPHIFDRFYQAKNLEKAKTGGTGIGLALTRELVQLLGGTINVQSQESRGTTFSVILPMHQHATIAAPPVSFPREAAGEKPEITPFENNPELPTLLLVEDNPDVVEFLTACLRQQYNLEFAFNGRAGIEKAIETIPDLVISDVMMPEKNGFEVCQALKEDERTSHIPIVLLTAKAGVENRIAGLRHGADAYLAKPFHQKELFATLQNLLTLRQKLQARYRNLDWATQQQPEPEQPLAPNASPDLQDNFLQKLTAQLEKHLDNADFSVPELAAAMGLSQSQLYRKIKALTDLSTAAFIRRYRLQKGKQLLQTTQLTMAEIAYQVGFTTPNYFSDAFFEEFAIRPNAMRK